MQRPPKSDVQNLWHDVLSVHHDGRTIQITQRRMQHGPPFGLVDLVTGEHRIAARGHIRRQREVESAHAPSRRAALIGANRTADPAPLR